MTQRSRARVAVPVVGGAVALALVATVWFGQRSQIYHPDRSPVPPAADVLPGARDVTFTTSDDVTLGAWYLPPSGTCSGAVLVAHGNGGNRAGRATLAQAIGDRGFGVLLLSRPRRGWRVTPARHGRSCSTRPASRPRT